jgi:GDP/UDP-N,N'-diacetylbacillosamine 2-epimerase (hydrolysing)
MKKRKICVVTGTRAEYGLLRWLMDGINKSTNLDLQIVVTGMHLSPEFGLTYQEIENDGFKIDKKIEMLLSADTPSSISKSTGLGLIGFADAFYELNPDIIIVLGDRYEVLAASLAAMFGNIPIAHIHGGETTAGAFDEAIRHSITKMSWWHFVAANEYQKRVIQLGENPDRVFNVGGLGVDAIKKTNLLSKDELMIKTGIKFGKKNLLITYHPVTLENKTSQQDFKSLLDVLSETKDIYLIFTMPNADSDGRIIIKMINDFVFNQSERSVSFTSLGSLNYLSTLQYIDGVVGNSSSGLAEAPTFKIGTINIGDRQKGRLKAESVIDCEPTKKSIKLAIDKLYGHKFQKDIHSVQNLYGDGDAIEKIMSILSNKPIPEDMKKDFYDL